MRRIQAEMRLDWVEPYSNGPYPHIPYVIDSNHPLFTAGTRLDYGFLKCALQDGYTVEIKAAPTEEIKRCIRKYEMKNGLREGTVATWGTSYLDEEPTR